MYLEHISMVYSVWGDISRTAALPGKACAFKLPALSLQRLSVPSRLPHQRLAVITVDSVLLLCRQLQKPHLTGVIPNQCSSAPPPPHLNAVLGIGRDPEPPHPPLFPWHILSWHYTDFNSQCSQIHRRAKSSNPVVMRNHWYHITDMFSHLLKVKVVECQQMFSVPETVSVVKDLETITSDHYNYTKPFNYNW